MKNSTTYIKSGTRMIAVSWCRVRIHQYLPYQIINNCSHNLTMKSNATQNFILQSKRSQNLMKSIETSKWMHF